MTGQTDPWNDQYEAPPVGSLPPDTRNILSYNGLRGCRDVFSRLQIAVMLYSIERGKSKNNRDGWKDLKAEYDEYEPDNDPTTARSITFGEIQERNFHQEYTSEDIWGNPVWTMCDVDWVRFVAPCTSTFHVFTSAMNNRLPADTRLTLFDQNLNQLAQNDNISANNKFSDIEWSFQSGNTYFISIDNMQPDQNRYYRLQVGHSASISGPNAICSNGSFSVTSIPGATYTWTVDNPILVNLFPNGNSINITRRRQGTANITLTVQITVGGCGTITVSKTFQFGATASTIIGPYDINQHTIMGVAYTNTTYYFVANEISSFFPAQSYTWTLFPPTDNPTLYSGQQPYITFIEPGYHTLQVSKQTECGSIVSSIIINVQQNYNGFRLSASPNPTSNQITATIDEETNEMKALSTDTDIKFELYDFNTAQIKKQWTYKNVQSIFTLNLSGINNGTYVLKATKGKHNRAIKIIIN